ncbi:MAG: hypothetical protein BSOLF_1959 [Candidatus Carbobacillus altaicus]|uniref:Uncharacterized protein n=1 Tax=Candidatus Carbonibacillus altaicus TaxID=2163959 RepID=A0A2R6XYL2_9BACL|nr:MAG: hypothetical protein BSOLF_1959 [Candidatus Carbobacillus altaicus]
MLGESERLEAKGAESFRGSGLPLRPRGVGEVPQVTEKHGHRPIRHPGPGLNAGEGLRKHLPAEGSGTAAAESRERPAFDPPTCAVYVATLTNGGERKRLMAWPWGQRASFFGRPAYTSTLCSFCSRRSMIQP